MVYIGCDHGGVELKNKLIDYIEAMGEEVKDLGACTSESVDYPDYGFAVGEAVAKDGGSRGIVICKTGVGMSICANKVKGVRALHFRRYGQALPRAQRRKRACARRVQHERRDRARDRKGVFDCRVCGRTAC